MAMIILSSLSMVAIAAMLNSLPVASQCTTKHCYDDEETNVMKTLLRIQDSISSLKEDLFAMKELSSVKEEMSLVKEEMSSLKEEIASLKDNLTVCLSKQPAFDCADLLNQGHTSSGVYTVYTRGSTADVYCDMETDGGGWLVFQRRQDGSVDFYRDWDSYKRGFGNPSGEFWLGNDQLHELTSHKPYTLRIDLGDWENQTRYAVYSTFSLGPESDAYRLRVVSYSGTAGDSLLRRHAGERFTTKDRDNDTHRSLNCAQYYKGAWWYGDCYSANLNGQWRQRTNENNRGGIHWQLGWHKSGYPFKNVEMKLRPTDL